MSDLRDRIAAVLEMTRPTSPQEAADALVAYLGGAEVAQMIRVRAKCQQCGWIAVNRFKADDETIPRFGYHSEMFAAISQLRVKPRQEVRCDHCEWVGPTHEFPPHLLTCECVNPSHPHGSDHYV